MARTWPWCGLLLLWAACASVEHRSDTLASERPQQIKAFYFGHSLLAGVQASPSYHIPYDVGVFAAAKGHAYDTHGQLGWGTPIAAHWAWNTDDLADGPFGFERENHAPFYAGRNGKAELANGDYNVVVFTDVNGNARGADQRPVVEAIVGFIQIARTRKPDALAVLYSCWNEIPVEQQRDRAALQSWHDVTLSELTWWEAVADAVKAAVGPERVLLVPVSAVFAELVLDAADGRMGSAVSAPSFFIDDVHGTPMTYYAAAAALYTAIFHDSPVGATTERVHAQVSGASIDYRLPSAQVARHIQQRAFDIVRNYPRAVSSRPQLRAATDGAGAM